MIGVGNRYRSDDGAGPEVARRIAVTGALAAREADGDPAALLEAWEAADAAVLVDAVRSGAPTGTIHRFDASATALPETFRGSTSTHALGLGGAIELGRMLGRLPARVVVYGIEGERFEHGQELSPHVAAALGELVERVSREAAALAAEGGSCTS